MTSTAVLPRSRPHVDEQAFRALVALIEANPHRYNEGCWLATAADGGTVMCLASMICHVGDLPVERLMSEDPTGESVTQAARGLLGLTSHQAQQLFGLPVDTTVDTLKTAITQILGITFGTQP